MSAAAGFATPLELPADVPPSNPSSRSISATSASPPSLARWRMAQEKQQQQPQPQSPSQASPGASFTGESKHRSKIEEQAEKRTPRVPQVVFMDPYEHHDDPSDARQHFHHRNGIPNECNGVKSPVRSISIEERSYRVVPSDHVRRSSSSAPFLAESEAPSQQQQYRGGGRGGSGRTSPAVAGDEPVRWSFASSAAAAAAQSPSSPSNREDHLQEAEHAGFSFPTAIAAAVPAMAEARTAAAAAYANRWTDGVRQSTSEEEAMVRAYRHLEVQLREAERRLNNAGVKQQRDIAALRGEWQKERAGRLKAEQDREELLSQAAIRPVISASSGGGGGTHAAKNILRVSAEAGDNRSHSLASGKDTAAAAGGGASEEAPATTTTYISETFYDKMKEREERARAQVRKEFVRQAQESVYAEQKKTAEAEKAAALATRQLKKAEGELSTAQEALQEATSVLEAKDVQLHERAIHIQELEAQLRLVQRQLESAEHANEQAEQQAKRKLEEALSLAEMRQAELEAQRAFAHQLQTQLGLKTRDLFDEETDRKGVLNLVSGLQTRCATLEKDLTRAVQETTALLDQRRQHAEDEAAVLREQNEGLKERCATAEAELASMTGTRDCDAAEMALLRERYEKDLDDQRVEVRSLQMQLDQVLAAARSKSSQASSASEIERRQQAALLRQYAADTAAAREALDRARAAMQRENAKHLHTVLELSQQVTALKQANTRLEHRTNVREHESAEATQLLARARDELVQLREERRRLCHSLLDVREDNRMRSVLEGPDVLQRRVVELENVRRDLHEKLMQANQTIECMQHRSHVVMEASRQSGALQERLIAATPYDSRVFEQHGPPPPQLSSSSSALVPAVSIVGREPVVGTAVKGKTRLPARASVVSSPAASLGLPELLNSMAEQLQPILQPASLPHNQQRQERRHPHETASSSGSIGQALGGAGGSTVAASPTPLTLRERRLQQSLHSEDRGGVLRSPVRRSCALHGGVTSPDVVDSPARRFSEAEDEEEGASRGWDSVPTPLSRGYHMRSSSRHQEYEPVVSATCTTIPSSSSHAPPVRPRRSSQPSLFSVAGEDLSVVRRSHASEAPWRGDGGVGEGQREGTTAATAPASVAAMAFPTQKDTTSFEQKGKVAQGYAVAAAVRERDELEPEPCWDSRSTAEESLQQTSVNGSVDDVRSPSCFSTPPAPSGAEGDGGEGSPGSQPAAPLQSVQKSASLGNQTEAKWRQRPSCDHSLPSSLPPAATATAPTTVGVVVGASPTPIRGTSHSLVPLVEGNGAILRYAPIPEEALSSVTAVTSRDISAIATPSLPDRIEEGSSSLFSNVHYISSMSPLPQAAPPLRKKMATTSSPARRRRQQQRATIPDGAMVIDVHKSTPPPARRRAPAY